MLEDFLWTQDIDIALLQEVTSAFGCDKPINTIHKCWDREKRHGDTSKRWHNADGHQMPPIRERHNGKIQRDKLDQSIRTFWV
jgi:hypothetical protein